MSFHHIRYFSFILNALFCGYFLTFTSSSALAWEWNLHLGSTVNGSGNIKSENRPVSGFTGLNLSLPADVELLQGNRESLIIETDDNILPLIETVVENGALNIRFKEKDSSIKTMTLKILVNIKNIDSLSISGSGHIYANTLQSAQLKTRIAGSGDLHIKNLTADSLTISVAGSGGFSAAGKVNSIEAKIAGSGDIKASHLEARTVKISVAGSGDAAVWATQSLTASVAGSGDVTYYGDAQVTQSVAGSGSIKRLGSAPHIS